MPQSIFTAVFPVTRGEQQKLRTKLIALNYNGLTPPADPLGFQSLEMLHYASLFMYEDPLDGWFLVFENNIDGEVDNYFQALIHLAQERDQGATLLDLFQSCQGFEERALSDLAAYFLQHVHYPSAGYSGCVGRTRNQILFEADIHRTASKVLSTFPSDADEAEVAKAIHNALIKDERFSYIADIPPETPNGEALLAAQSIANRPEKPEGASLLFRRLCSAIKTAWKTDGIKPVITVVFASIVFILMGIWNQLRKEPSAPEDTQRPDLKQVGEQQSFEDFSPTNHMISVVHSYPDFSRRWAKWAAFTLLDFLARYKFTHGLLGTIPTIHFAHWATLNDHRRTLFVSNFDGSWDSYLDDFTLKAAKGLTLAWAHGVGFPKSIFMLWGGAAKGPQFIDWARRSMVPSLAWYNAYPGLSIRNINLNSALRQALVKDTEQNNATNWLELIQ